MPRKQELPSEGLLKAIGDAPPVEKTDKLDALRAEARRVQELKLEISNLEALLSEEKTKLNVAIHETLPNLLDAAGVPFIGVDAHGNLPAQKFEAKPYYSASISAEWPEEKREAAFEWLEKNDAADLIKVNVTVSFGKGHAADAAKLVAEIKKKDLDAEIKMARSVNFMTLKAWLRETVEAAGVPAGIDTIGGTVGRYVTIKDIKK